MTKLLLNLFEDAFNYQDRNKYKYYEDRIETFQTWPKAHPIKATELCSAGFIYSGQSDRVQCFSCKVILHSFNSTDCVIKEHQIHSKECEFIKSFTPNLK